jgi:hypothetical protein
MIPASQIVKNLSVKTAQVNRSAMFSSKAITKDEVIQALDNWGKGLVSISKAYAEKGDYVGTAKTILSSAYGYELGTVLFKPTLASKVTFRGTSESALSYFVGGNPKYDEDTGFAIRPWKKVDFETAGIITGEDHALVMGNKLLQTPSNDIVKANFTMAFFRDPTTGKLKINLHHSSLPYVPAN